MIPTVRRSTALLQALPSSTTRSTNRPPVRRGPDVRATHFVQLLYSEYSHHRICGGAGVCIVGVWSISQERRDELMDDPALPDGEHMHALAALRTINAISLTAKRLAEAVERLLPRGLDRPLVVADLACGGGDVTVALADRLACRSHFRSGRVPFRRTLATRG